MMKPVFRIAAGGAMVLACGLAGSQAMADTGREALLTTSCFTCHSIDATGNMPNLVGYPRDLMISQMQMFSNGSRPSTIMDRIARGYSEADYVVMADYFATIEQ
ncbi:c-type cytochrome [Thioalkalivibrio paradoxus]|uniref:Cytochrome C n=1 Tax=Thioalkalivibrio paradoxus ARh 1 TaxID=713585 RepID=W0DIV6_9GAMM|nr:c-type cytochrome [Thioalkalivibrio paradoxus]AHE98376.1 cytochrome C [Thioalkalivibrio paradoxus ARh 1]